jgi:hypothetical protein
MTPFPERLGQVRLRDRQSLEDVPEEAQPKPDRRRLGCLKPIAGVGVLMIAAWMGYRLAPVKTVVQTEVRTVERLVTDDTELNRLRQRVAALKAERDSAIARAKAAESALEQVRRELAAAHAEIQRLMAELAANKPVESNANAQCVKCGYLMNFGQIMRKEDTRCRNCGLIQSVKSTWARRAYVLEMERRRRASP